MKKIKVSLLGVAAIVLGICASAFTATQKTNSGKTQNYKYRYQLTDNSGMSNPANYVFTTDLSGCEDGNIVCIIDAPGTGLPGSHPSFPLNTDPYDNEEGVTVFSDKP